MKSKNNPLHQTQDTSKPATIPGRFSTASSRLTISRGGIQVQLLCSSVMADLAQPSTFVLVVAVCRHVADVTAPVEHPAAPTALAEAPLRELISRATSPFQWATARGYGWLDD